MNSFAAKKFIEYKLKAKNEHALHSPFAFNFYCNVIDVEESYYLFDKLSKVREQLQRDKSTVKVEEMGAGSKHFKGNTRQIRDIAKHGITSEKYCRLLFRIAEFLNAKHIVEIGTSAGLTSMYLCGHSAGAHLTTLEGNESLCAFASELHKKNGFAEKIEIVQGHFDETLPPALNKLPQLDLYFIDGNHREAPTLKYFEQGLLKAHNDSIFILDDIYWSEEMEQAWTKIKEHPRVTMTMDLFQFGLVFFRKEHLIKEDFILRY